MLESIPPKDTAVVALAGRRIDGTDTHPSRFPLDAVAIVRRRLADLLTRERAAVLVCSAACGADLLALEEAERLGLRRRIIIPFPADQFRRTSVIDRPGDWGRVFDRLVTAAATAGDLVVLSRDDGSGETAYAAANEAIIGKAQKLAQKGAPHRLVAAVVWEGLAKPGSDATGQFRELATKAGFENRVVLTRSVVHEAKDYLKGHQLTPEQIRDLVKRLKNETRFGWARRILAKVREAPILDATLRTWFAQQHALCTHKDPDLPVLWALDL
jgi:hypothetical protein